MYKKLFFFVAALFCAVLSAQTQTQPPAKSPEPAPRIFKAPSYVRRFSAGATLSVLILNPVRKATTTVDTTTPPVSALYYTDDASQRAGYGLSAQLALTERFAVNAGLLIRRIGYQMNSDIYEGVDNPLTTKDDRTHTVRHEDTRSRILDIPMLVRYYGKDRSEPGPRWFFEGGVARRSVSHIRTSVSSSVNSGDTVCCELAPVKPAQNTITGLVAGFGVQVIDPIGVRVVPEVRYTRWRGRTFDAFSTSTRSDQIEVMFSLTF
jgi:hypothetical protein